MTYGWLFCVLIFHALVGSCIADVKPRCEKTLSLCKVELNEGDGTIKYPQRGPKGEMGDRGFNGQRGDVGDMGLTGSPGMPGLQGLRGPPGDKIPGLRGDVGERGSSGMKGIRGPPGLNGLNGKKGTRGDKGTTGLIGPPGFPGPNGRCPCNTAGEVSPDSAAVITDLCKNSVSVTNVLTRVKYKNQIDYDIIRRHISSGGSSLSGALITDFTDSTVSESYSMELEEEDLLIDVECFLRGNEATLTCIPKLTTELQTFNLQNISSGFWLSSKGFKIEDIYGIDRRILNAILKRSNSAFQTIRYHCYNSVPFPRDNLDKALLLLTWNDNTIGPMPTLTRPFFYSVENDGCSNNKIDTWSYTDIKIVSDSPHRVPIIDFYIRDIRNDTEQKIKIEHLQLCFD